MASEDLATDLAMSRDAPFGLDKDALSLLWATIREPERALMQTSPFDPDDDGRILASIVESEAQIPFASLLELLRPTLGLLERIPQPQAVALEGALALRPGPASLPAS